jgi:hypothetical protein
VKYLQGFNFSTLAVAEKSEIKNLGRAATGLFNALQQYKLKWENLIPLYMHNMRGWVALMNETLY